jgi:NAD(P)H-quinone oxidoreductase subunit 4
MILSALILVPLLGSLIVGFYPGVISLALSRSITIGFASISLLLTIVTGVMFDLGHIGLQMQEFLPWLPDLGLNYSLAIDGLSFPLVALTNLLTVLLAFNSSVGLKPGEDLKRPRLFYSLLLLVNSGVIGAFLAQNLMLFFLFYEVELIPFYLLIVIWGSAKREYAATKFLIYTALSGVLILAAFLAMNWLTGAASFEYGAIDTTDLSRNTQLILLTLLLIGFGIKTPLVPLHSWLPDAYVESSAPVSIMLGGILSKLGTYGIIRFAVGLFPETWVSVAPVMATIAAITVIYGSFCAIAQTDMKRMVAYSSIGHMGYIILGTAALTPLSMVGVISQMVAHGLILALLFYLIGMIESKVGTRELDLLNGLLNPIRGLPMISALLILGAMASAGIPGMVGFIAEFMVFQGSFSAFPVQTLVTILGTALTAVYFVILLNQTCFGKLDTKSSYYAPVARWEYMPAFILTIVIIFLGVQPSWLVRWSQVTSDAIAFVM